MRAPAATGEFSLSADICSALSSGGRPVSRESQGAGQGARLWSLRRRHPGRIRSLSLTEKRLHLEAHPQQVGRVDRVALVEGALLARIEHWPTATEVVGVPLTDALARTLGMQLSILTGKVTRAEQAPLASRWPEVL